MRLLVLGDLHITGKQPKGRIDQVNATQFSKLSFAFKKGANEGVSAALQPGDFFDSDKCSNDLLQYTIRFFKQLNIKVYVTLGQHDMRYHSGSVNDSPLSVLEASGVVEIVKGCQQISTGVRLYAAPWGNSTLPDIDYDYTGASILLTHRMIIHKKKLWSKQEDYTEAESLLKKTEYDLIVSGDNHQNFHAVRDSRYLINCGSLMRSTTAQIDHRPAFYIYNTESKTAKRYFYPIKPPGEVFDLQYIEAVEKKKEKTEWSQAFLQHVRKNTAVSGLDYKLNMKRYISKNENVLHSATIKILEKNMEEI